MEFIFLFILLKGLIVYYTFFRHEDQEIIVSTTEYDMLPRKSKKALRKEQMQKSTFIQQEEKKKNKRAFTLDELPIVTNLKEILISTFKDGKLIKNAHISSDGKLITLSDEKRIAVFVLNSLSEKNPKCYTRNVENDVITDLGLCEQKKILAVGMKNSKEIIFYELAKDKTEGKTKLKKIEKKVIKSDHRFEIRHIVFSRDGSYLATCGANQDTKIHIYNGNSLMKIESININEIQNFDLKFSSDEKYLTVSTYMFEIGIIEFKKSSKFNKVTNSYETITKIEKTKSIGNIRVPILSYNFSNNPFYFIMSMDGRKIRIYQSFLNLSLEDSKILKEIDLDFEDPKFLPNAQKVTMYVIESKQNEFDCIFACSYEGNIYIFNKNGDLIRYMQKAHEGEIINMKLLRDPNCLNDRELCLISISVDGRVNLFKVLF